MTWFRLLARYRFAVHRSRWRVAAIISAWSLLNTVFRLAQGAVYGRRVAREPVPRAPVFILGHWRTGTTLLHELLGCDPRHAFPTTYECFSPHHFLITRSWLRKWLARRVSGRRPMDNMLAGWDRPQEDEFALCLLGQPSPYERFAFPNCPDVSAGAFDLGGLSPRALHGWKTALLRFTQALTLVNPGRRLILKSPPHTCRIRTLLELFPDARFVHVIRDPYVVYPSTLHLFRVLDSIHGLQCPRWNELPEQVLNTFVQFHERLEEGKRLIPAGHFCEIRYEDLLGDPIGRLAAVYDALDLGDFAPAHSSVQAYMASVARYQTNRYLLTPAERCIITQRWGPIIQRYGYASRQ